MFATCGKIPWEAPTYAFKIVNIFLKHSVLKFCHVILKLIQIVNIFNYDSNREVYFKQIHFFVYTMIARTALINRILAIHVCKFQFKKYTWGGDQDH
jgi:hypothetical protein